MIQYQIFSFKTQLDIFNSYWRVELIGVCFLIELASSGSADENKFSRNLNVIFIQRMRNYFYKVNIYDHR